MNKYNYRDKSIFNGKSNNLSKTTSFYYGVVVPYNDISESGKIKVRINGVDLNTTSDEDLPDAFPMLPKFFSIRPKVGETVLIFPPDIENPYYDRFYIGPLISQPQMLENDLHLGSSKSGLDSATKELGVAPSTIPECKGVFSNGDDTTLQGRYNADIVFKRNEIVLRAGKFNDGERIKNIPTFNLKNQSYIQIKNSYKPLDSNKKIGVINIVSNKINLLSHENGSPIFNLNDSKNNISDEELTKILQTAHPLAFGDLMVEYLILMRNVILSHVHSYPGLGAQDLSGNTDIQKLLEYDIKQLVSKNIKIN